MQIRKRGKIFTSFCENFKKKLSHPRSHASPPPNRQECPNGFKENFVIIPTSEMDNIQQVIMPVTYVLPTIVVDSTMSALHYVRNLVHLTDYNDSKQCIH